MRFVGMALALILAWPARGAPVPPAVLACRSTPDDTLRLLCAIQGRRETIQPTRVWQFARERHL
jgi:hypothetical protein